MSEKKIRRVPVVEDDRLVGIVTQRDLLQWVDAAATD
jgi:CBS domain-containing protein